MSFALPDGQRRLPYEQDLSVVETIRSLRALYLEPTGRTSEHTVGGPARPFWRTC